jgi:hypothetical protein
VRGRRSLQIISAILAIIPVATGLIGLSGIRDPLYTTSGASENVLLDSNLRFYSGVWLGLGLALLWLIPRIEKQLFYSESFGEQFYWAELDGASPCYFSR